MSAMTAPKAQAVGGEAKTKGFQFRADEALLKEIKSHARERHVSANKFVVEAVRAALRAANERRKEQEWRAGFEAMGHDPDTNNVEYALPAAYEAVFSDGH